MSSSKHAQPVTDPFLSKAMIRYHLTEFPDPVSIENPQYVCTVHFWAAYLLMTGSTWEMIENDHGVPGTLLTAFRLAIVRDFPAQVEFEPLITRVVNHFKNLADIVLHHDKKRGPEELLKRLQGTTAMAHDDMLLLLAARMELEGGVEAAEQVRKSKIFTPTRFPPSLAPLLQKMQQKSSGAGGKTARPQSKAAVCEHCRERVTGGYQAHNLVCSARENVKGTNRKKTKK